MYKNIKEKHKYRKQKHTVALMTIKMAHMLN